MPIGYTGKQTDQEERPDGERAIARMPMQPLQAGQQANAYLGRTYQPPTGPTSTPGQQSAMPWAAGLGGLAAGKSSTPWAQALGGGGGGQAMGGNTSDADFSAYMNNRNQQAFNQQLGQQQQANAANNAALAQRQQAFNTAYNNQAFNQAYDQQRAAAGGGGGGMGGGMGGGAAPNWAALSQRFGGAPISFGGLGALGGTPGGGLGGNPWLQNLMSGLAQRFSGLQQRGGGSPVQGMPIIPQRRS